MGFDAALGAALAGMDSQQQAMDWAGQCDWAGGDGPGLASVAASRLPVQFAWQVLEYAASHAGDAPGSGLAVLVRAMAGALGSGRGGLAEQINQACLGLAGSAHDIRKSGAAGLVGHHLQKGLVGLSGQKSMEAMVGRMAGIALAAGQESQMGQTIIDGCIRSGAGSPASSRKMGAVARVLLKQGIRMDAAAVGRMDQARSSGYTGFGYGPAWPGTWISIAKEIDARPVGEAHAADLACAVAIKHIKQATGGRTGEAAARRQDLLCRLAGSVNQPQSLVLIAWCDEPDEWSPELVELLMSKAGGTGLALEVAAGALLGASDDAWQACVAHGGGAVLEGWAGGVALAGACPQEGKVGAMDPQESRTGERLASLEVGATQIVGLLHGARFMDGAMDGWDLEKMEAAIAREQMSLRAPAAVCPLAARPRM